MQTSIYNEIELITLVGVGPKLTIDLPKPLHFDIENYDYQIGLHSFQVYNSIPNISKLLANNSIKITPGEGEKELLITLDDGAYEIRAINASILDALKVAGVEKPEESFNLKPNSSTFKSFIELGEGWVVDFNVENSIAPVLGYNKKKLSGQGIYKSDNIVKINSVNSFLFNTNITEPSLLNKKYIPYVYHYSINIGPGYNIVKRIPTIIYKNLTTTVLSTFSVWITNEKEQLINFNGEVLTVEFCLRRIRKPNSTKVSDGSFR